MKLLACLLATACLGQISPPLVGYFRDRSNALRAVYGMAGAFVAGKAAERGVVAAAWSGAAGFAKTESEILVLNATGIVHREAAPEGGAAFGFLPDGQPGWVRLADGSCRKFGADCPTDPPARPPIRSRLPQTVVSFEQLGDGWLVARTARKLYAVRTGPVQDEVYELPEEEEEP